MSSRLRTSSGATQTPPVPKFVTASEDMGDTDALVSGRTPTPQAEGGSLTEILEVINETLTADPSRADLHMMRFEVYATMGMKPQFAEEMSIAWANRTLRSLIDWAAIQKMWNRLAPGEQPPKGILFPSLGRRTSAAATVSAPEPERRRFSDIAMQLAGDELTTFAKAYQTLRSAPAFYVDFAKGTRDLLNRPTPLQEARVLGVSMDGRCRVFFKREDVRKQGPETEIAVAQAYLASKLGKSSVITGNDIDEFSVALAKAAPTFGLDATIVLKPGDDQRSDFVDQLRQLGATVETMRADGLKSNDPREEALWRWRENTDRCHLALSFALGPHPYPQLVNDFQILLGYETDLQMRAHPGGGHPRTMIASVHSEADAIGFMLMYLRRPEVSLFYAEPQRHQAGKSPSTRLRAYNGATREHAWLRSLDRIMHVAISDSRARSAQEHLQEHEHIEVGLEDARAVALALDLAEQEKRARDYIVLVG